MNCNSRKYADVDDTREAQQQLAAILESAGLTEWRERPEYGMPLCCAWSNLPSAPQEQPGFITFGYEVSVNCHSTRGLEWVQRWKKEGRTELYLNDLVEVTEAMYCEVRLCPDKDTELLVCLEIPRKASPLEMVMLTRSWLKRACKSHPELASFMYVDTPSSLFEAQFRLLDRGATEVPQTFYLHNTITKRD